MYSIQCPFPITDIYLICFSIQLIIAKQMLLNLCEICLADALNTKHMHHTRMKVCRLPQRSHFLGPGRSHQERQSPGNTLIVTSQLSVGRLFLHQASRGTISHSHAGPYRWKPGGLQNRERHWLSGIYSVSHVL